jgi:hypothetical protein
MLCLANVSYDLASSYYTEAETGTWQGKGAESLALRGEVEVEVYQNLLMGRSPDGRQSLTGKRVSSEKRRAATDFVFTPPKSVSLAVLLDEAEDIRHCHREAVRSAIAYLETYAGARVTKRGVTQFVPTGNNIVAAFEHIEARGVKLPKEFTEEGESLFWAENPHLHTHCVCINLTQLRDGSWRSLTNDQMVAHQKKVRQVYEGSLRVNMEDLGYKTRDKADCFELRGYSDEMIQLFSQRRQMIQWIKEELGKDEETAWGMSRQPKRLKTEEELKQQWHSKALIFNWELLHQQRILALTEADMVKQRVIQEKASQQISPPERNTDLELD